MAAVSLRLYDQPPLLGDKGLTLRDVLFCLDELSQKNFPVHALRLRRTCDTSGSFGTMTRIRVPRFVTKAVKLFFRLWTVKPLKCVFNRRTVKPLKYLL